MATRFVNKAPRTKEELMNKMLSYDFDGDIRKLGPNARLERVNANALALTFPDIGRTYVLSVHIPKDMNEGPKPRAKAETPTQEPEVATAEIRRARRQKVA